MSGPSSETSAYSGGGDVIIIRRGGEEKEERADVDGPISSHAPSGKRAGDITEQHIDNSQKKKKKKKSW